jgi:hypothetical protein
VDSAQWLQWKVPWVAILAVVLAGLVAIFGRIETRAVTRPAGIATAPGRPGWLAGAAASGYAAVVVGLLWQAAAGSADHGPFALPTGALLLYLAGAAVLRLARAVTRVGAAEAPRATPG